MWEEVMNCPKCGKELSIDSVREHKDGKKRAYWECRNCDLNIMFRGGK